MSDITTAPVATTPVATTPIATTPVATTPVATTPVATTPIATTPVATTPIATTPVATTPIATTPIATTPIATTPIATTPIATKIITLAYSEDTAINLIASEGAAINTWQAVAPLFSILLANGGNRSEFSPTSARGKLSKALHSGVTAHAKVSSRVVKAWASIAPNALTRTLCKTQKSHDSALLELATLWAGFFPVATKSTSPKVDWKKRAIDAEASLKECQEKYQALLLATS